MCPDGNLEVTGIHSKPLLPDESTLLEDTASFWNSFRLFDKSPLELLNENFGYLTDYPQYDNTFWGSSGQGIGCPTEYEVDTGSHQASMFGTLQTQVISAPGIDESPPSLIPPANEITKATSSEQLHELLDALINKPEAKVKFDAKISLYDMVYGYAALASKAVCFPITFGETQFKGCEKKVSTEFNDKNGNAVHAAQVSICTKAKGVRSLQAFTRQAVHIIVTHLGWIDKSRTGFQQLPNEAKHVYLRSMTLKSRNKVEVELQWTAQG